MVAELSHRPPGLREITPERTPVPPRSIDVTVLTLRSQRAVGLTTPSPHAHGGGVAEYTSMPPGVTKNTQKANPTPQAIGGGRTYSRVAINPLWFPDVADITPSRLDDRTYSREDPGGHRTYPRVAIRSLEHRGWPDLSPRPWG